MAHSDTLHAGIVAPAESSKRPARRSTAPLAPTWSDVWSEESETGQANFMERMAAQRKTFKQQQERKFYDSDHGMPSKQDEWDQTWNIYVWAMSGNDEEHPTGGHWRRIGQRRKKPGRRKPMTQNRLFAGIRQQHGIPRHQPVLLVSPRDDKGPDSHPEPKHRDTLRPWTPPPEALAVRDQPEPHVTKHKKDRSPKLDLERKEDRSGRVTFTFKTRYVAWGQRPHMSKDGSKWFYLGPVASTTKRSGVAEIRHRFPIYPDPVLLEVRSLSYSLRTRIRTGAIIPGVTKMPLPEAK